MDTATAVTVAGPQRTTLLGQVGRFAVVGLVCTVVHLGLFTIFHRWWDSQVANLVALVSWTFRSARRGNWVRQQAQALGVFLLTWAATSGGLALLESGWPNAPVWGKVLALAAATALSTVVRFVAMRRWIFAAAA